MQRTISQDLTKDTTLCISLAGRPGNTGTRFHNYLYDALGLDFVYKAFTTTDIKAAVAGVRGLHGGPERLARARKARLVEYAVAARLVTASDLELLPDASRA